MPQLAAIQYDIYQRYTILAASFDAVFAAREQPFRVLDVGSGPESLAKRFLDGRFEDAAAIFRDMIDAPRFAEFLTLPAYEKVLADGG